MSIFLIQNVKDINIPIDKKRKELDHIRAGVEFTKGQKPKERAEALAALKDCSEEYLTVLQDSIAKWREHYP